MERTDAPSVAAGRLTSAEVYASHHGRIERYLARLVRDPEEAEDLAQETFLRAHRELGSLRDPAALTTWLYRIATHVAYDRFRQSRERYALPQHDPGRDEAEDEPEWADPDAPKLDELFEQSEMSACVNEFVADLPDGYRAVILLHDLGGLRDREIAQLLGCSLANVKVRLHRARLKLRSALADACEFARDRRGVFVCERRSACR